MSSISGISSSAPLVYAPYRATSRAAVSAPTQSIDPGARAQALTRQLDDTLTDKLARIRQQISPISNSADDGTASPRRLDIRA